MGLIKEVLAFVASVLTKKNLPHFGSPKIEQNTRTLATQVKL